MIRILTWSASFAFPALVLWHLATALLVPVGLLAAHALVQGGGEVWP